MAIKFTQAIDLANQRITGVGSPSVGTDAVNKTYVDNAILGLSWKQAVRAASTGNINLSAPGATIDGVAMAANDRFLAKDQTAGAENGVYVWNGAAVAATRALDADSSADLLGMAVSVEEGSTNADGAYLLITDGPITLGTDPLVYSIIGGGTPYVGGAGLTLTGATFDVGAGTGITVAANSVGIDTAVVVRKFAANVGDGASTAITVTHGLATRDVKVEVYTNASPWDTVLCEVSRPNVNDVTLTFGTAPAAAAYRVTVQG